MVTGLAASLFLISLDTPCTLQGYNSLICHFGWTTAQHVPASLLCPCSQQAGHKSDPEAGQVLAEH